jgi:CheY-like chemotaxis protein
MRMLILPILVNTRHDRQIGTYLVLFELNYCRIIKKNGMDLSFASNSNKKGMSTIKRVPNILVVDDEPLVCWSIENTLIKEGFRVTTINSGETAIQLLFSNHFDLVITDLELPNMDGFQVAMAAKRYSPSIPIIMISACDDPEYRKRSKGVLIDYFIDKPFDLQEIVALVVRLIDRYSTF